MKKSILFYLALSFCVFSDTYARQSAHTQIKQKTEQPAYQRLKKYLTSNRGRRMIKRVGAGAGLVLGAFAVRHFYPDLFSSTSRKKGKKSPESSDTAKQKGNGPDDAPDDQPTATDVETDPVPTESWLPPVAERQVMRPDQLLDLQNVEAVAREHTQPTQFDNRVYATGVEDMENSWTTPQVLQFTQDTLKPEFRSDTSTACTIIQLPVLYQGDKNRKGNHCGYYAFYNAHVLNAFGQFLPQFIVQESATTQEFNESLKNSGLQNRQQFSTFMHKALEFVVQARRNPVYFTQQDLFEDVGDVHINIPQIAELLLPELQQLQANRERFGTGFENEITSGGIHDDRIAMQPNESRYHFGYMTKALMRRYLTSQDVPRHVYIANTSRGGSHWLAFSFEKHSGHALIYLADSIGRDRAFVFQEALGIGEEG